MDETEELLKLIEDGNAIEILKRKNLRRNLDTLCKKELIQLEGGAIKVSTTRTQELRRNNKSKYRTPVSQDVLQFPNIHYVVFLTLLIISVALLIIGVVIIG